MIASDERVELGVIDEALEEQLPRAIENGHTVVEYLPAKCAVTKEITGAPSETESSAKY